MVTPTLDSYYERMTASLGDKARVLPFVTGTSVLDVGCGSGDLMRLLNSEGFVACGVDASPESVERADSICVKTGYADEIDTLFGTEAFDTVICCSVFHEVFSYGNRSHRRGRLESLSDALHAAYNALRPGGRLIVRDGVAPPLSGRYSMSVDNPTAVCDFLMASPFAYSGRTLDRRINIERTGFNTFSGSASSLMEFAFTYTWGPDAFEREVQEYYGIFTLDGYRTFVERHGFKHVKSFSYTQPDYPEHLEGKVKFDMPFPDTNAIWIYEK